MITEFTAVSSKEVMTLLQGIHHVYKLHNIYSTDFSQLLHIFREFMFLYIHSLIRTPCWNHHRIVLSLVSSIFNMIVQIIDGVISRTDAFHTVVLHQSTSRKLRLLQFLITLIENLTCCLGAQQFVNTESRFQFQMCPMVQRVTQCIGNCFSPLFKFLPI